MQTRGLPLRSPRCPLAPTQAALSVGHYPWDGVGRRVKGTQGFHGTETGGRCSDLSSSAWPLHTYSVRTEGGLSSPLGGHQHGEAAWLCCHLPSQPGYFSFPRLGWGLRGLKAEASLSR